MRTHLTLLLSLTCILGAWFGFYNPLYHFPPASLVLPAGLLLLASRATGFKKAFKYGYLAGGAALAATLYWISLSVHDYGKVPWFLAAFCPVIIGLVLGLFTGFYTVVCHLALRRFSPLFTALSAGLAWSVSEYLRSILFTGFPWNILPSAFAPWPSMLQTLSLVGVYGLSLILACAACLACLVFSSGRCRVAGPLLSILILAGLASYGDHVLSLPMPEGRQVNVALIQGNIDQSHKWSPQYQRGTIERYSTLSRSAAEDGPLDLIIWPETAVPFFFQEQSILSDAIHDLARELATPMLIGSPGYRIVDPPDEYILFNRAYFLDQTGVETGVYGKEHLVPFGEYIPLESILFFLDKMVEGVGDFRPGLSTTPVVHDDLALGVLICYESIFTSLTNRRISDDANLLVNISNDAWFGKSAAPRQHLYLSALRAVEQERYLVRGTNTGISAIIDPRGRIVQESDLFRPMVVRGTVNLLQDRTVYHRLFNFIVPIIVGLFAGFLFTAMARPDKKKAALDVC